MSGYSRTFIWFSRHGQTELTIYGDKGETPAQIEQAAREAGWPGHTNRWWRRVWSALAAEASDNKENGCG